MKSFLLLLLSAALACGQTHATVADRPQMTAGKLSREGALVKGSGHVRAKLGPLTLEADEGVLHSDTGEVELRGHVGVTLPARSDRNIFRYGSDIVFSDQPVLLSADRLNVKDALLRGSGHIQVKTTKDLLAADEIEMYLSNGDARVRGNVRVNRTPPNPSGVGGGDFPPDIIKK
jgi:lipopolysaccharide assembly outer membrane protein LptD (OstA)